MSLQLDHISFGFLHDKPILHDVSLTLATGTIYAMIGSNGAGKTTLFNIITGFLRPQEGAINLQAEGEARMSLAQLPPYKINRAGIGRTFQDLRLITKLSVRENILLAMKDNPADNWMRALLPQRIYRNTTQQRETLADSLLEQYFLSDVRDALAGEISYGQQKLLTLACCVANGADVLLLDEAVAGVQPVYRERIAALIKGLKEEGKTILVIEHNTDFIAEIADEIFFLHEGKLARFGNMDLLRADKAVMEAYL